MATLSQSNGGGERRTGASPRPKGRENSKDTLCRNVTIYGHCRYQDKGCAFNHETARPQAQHTPAESVKKRLNVDSPTFTPGTMSMNGNVSSNGNTTNNGNNVQNKGPGISPRAASAAPFRPKNFTPTPSSVTSSNTSSSLKPYNPNAPDFLAPEAPEFLPHTYNSVASTERHHGRVVNPPNPGVLQQYSPMRPRAESSTIEHGTQSGRSSLDPTSPVFEPRPNGLLPSFGQNLHLERLREERPTSTSASQPDLRFNRMFQRPLFQSPLLPSQIVTQKHTHDSFLQGENSNNFISPMSYDALYNESSSMAAPTSNDPDLAGAFYSSDAGTGPSNLFPAQVNQSLAHQPLQYHLYADLSPTTSNLQTNQKLARDSFLPEDLRQKLHRKSETLLRTFGNTQSLSPYHSLTPLPESTKASGHFPQYESSLFKAIDSRDGRTYCLRRIYPFRIDDSNLEEIFKTARNAWRRVRNSNIVSLHELFTTAEAFGESSLIIVSDYHSESVTLQQWHTNKYGFGSSRRSNLSVSESLLRKYIVQISSALKAIHAQGLCARLISADKMLLTDEDCVRFNGCAMGDLLDPTTQTILDLQRSDLSSLGNLIISLGTPHMKSKNFEHFERSYSSHIVDPVSWLLHAGNERTITKFLSKIGSLTMDCFGMVEDDNDVLQGYLSRELENGRLVRLLSKLNTINERPEYANDPLWSEYGPRGKIKLFRDYVFHQVDEQGRPVLNMGHMLECLNKLDAGLDEKFKLESRDGKSILLVSFKEMKQLIESSFQDLSRRSRA